MNLHNFQHLKDENKNPPHIDIIMPNFNKGKFIEESINSVIYQTYNNWKLLIIDDNSNDNSKKIINNYKNHKIEIIYLNKNKGVAFCRNLAIRYSNSKYIAFLDSDDYWSTNKLSEQIFFMEKFNYVLTYTDYTPFFEKKSKIFFKTKVIAPDSLNYNQFINNTSIAMSSMIVKRETMGAIRFPKVKICEDYYFKCKILKKGNRAIKLSKNNMFYRITKNSLQSNKFKNFYWVWYINKKYNQLSFFKNLKSLMLITINSIKRYGIK